MNDALRSRLHDLALSARRLLTDETRTLLAAVYGLAADGRLEAVSKLPAVQSIAEVAETRARLEHYLRDEAAAGRSGAEAVERLVRETAFTHLNRLVAFKLLEARKITRGTLDKHHESNGFKFYLVENPVDEARYQAGDLPQDALGEGPRDIAYRNFLLWQTAQLAREVPVLFDAANLATRLFPRPRVLHQLIDALNAPELHDAWSAGNEETIGWIYQYFNELEKHTVFERLNKQKQKIRREDLPAATQLFTPRWIVRFLIENTLGRHWLQMHPDSRLATELEYLVPLAGEVPAEPLKPVRELTLLDPACGTMHFGLVAFDLFAAMYREELERAGEAGWPATPSVASVDAIPAAVLANNLFGIDIDLRAVQLAALSLYVRAKALSPKITVTPRNLVCADVTVLDDSRLSSFVKALGRRQPAVESAMRALWPHLKQSGELGTLLRLEDDLQGAFAPSRRSKQRTGAPMLPGLEDGDSGQYREFNDVDTAVRAALNEFARQEAARGDDATAFVAGTEQGLKLLDLLQRRYDLVVANPPYMSSSNMPASLAEFLKKAYPEGRGDLYAAFIMRCAQLVAVDGRLGMITQQSFMFVPSYEKLREKLLSASAIEALYHVGPRAFAEVSGEKVNTVLFTLRRDPSSRRRQVSVGSYIRLVREPDAEAKRIRFEKVLKALRIHGSDPQAYYYHQSDFDVIPNSPWVYSATSRIQTLFRNLRLLKQVAQVRQGLATADNFRFIRYWWETGFAKIGCDYTNLIDAQRSGKRWFTYVKEGGQRRWWRSQQAVLNWFDDGVEIKAHVCHAYPYLNGKWEWVVKNADSYFLPAITYTAVSSKGFAARLMPPGFPFDHASNCIFPESAENISGLLGIVNSSFASGILRLLNETINYYTGDLERIPVPQTISGELQILVEQAIVLAKQDSAESETTYDFVAPPAWPAGGADVAARHAELAAVERAIDEEVYRLYGIEGADRRAIEEELSIVSSQLAVEDGEEQPASEDEPEATDKHQLTIDILAQRWLSYALGVALGRFQPGVESAIGRGQFAPEVSAKLRALADEDGIGLIEPGHPDDLGTRVTRALELMHGEDAAHAIIAAATGGRTLHTYLIADFYREHVRQYRKRPVYWLLQSPGRKYSLLLFHERLTGDSLPLILGNRYVGGKINALRSRLGELQGSIAAAAPGREKRQAERERDAAADLLTDAEEFARRIRAVLDQPNERGEAVGWRPAIDDGVLLNLAPLHTLIPAWTSEPKKAWQALERGDYDWAHTAMRYWPDRVLAKCRTNTSFAIAHGVE